MYIPVAFSGFAWYAQSFLGPGCPLMVSWSVAGQADSDIKQPSSYVHIYSIWHTLSLCDWKVLSSHFFCNSRLQEGVTVLCPEAPADAMLKDASKLAVTETRTLHHSNVHAVDMLYYHGYGMGTKLADLERLLKSDGGGAWRSPWATAQKQRTNSILTTGNLLNRPTVLHAQIEGVVRIFIQPQFAHCPSSFSYSSIITVYFVYCNIINHHKLIQLIMLWNFSVATYIQAPFHHLYCEDT